MYKTKKDVDKYVEKLLTKLCEKEFKSRAYSVARLYFEVGDYANCQKYVEQYLTQKDNNAAAYKLLGQALQKMGQKDKALEQFKTSLDIDQTQTGIILDICELLADEDVAIEPGRANYWLEKAEATFPRHQVTFQLRERVVTMSDPDPEALVKLLTMELNARPKDPSLHARLLKHYLHMNQFKESFEHSCNIEFSSNNFTNNYAWYEVLDDLLKNDLGNYNKWLYQLLLLTVKERICLLSLMETPSGSSKSLVESSQLLHAYDQALEYVAKAGAAPGFAEFHAALLQHHRGQLFFHAATFLLKKAKKDLISWSEATKAASPLMLLAWQAVPLDSKVNWLRTAPEKQLNAVNRWYSEGTYRCSQSGHYLLTNFQDKNQSLLDQISQYCSGTNWKDKLYENIFTCKTYLTKMSSSHIKSNAFSSPQLRLPRKIEVEAYDSDAQKEYGNSLHHFVWTLMNYKNYSHFKCTLFDMLTPTITSCGPETLNKLDIYAFLYCAALTTRQKKNNQVLYIHEERPSVLPANITELLCPLPQMKWWDCAYKYSQNILGNELTDIRATLSRGIEVVRCVDSHGLDPELLCTLGRIFSDRAKVTTSVEDKTFIEARAGLYYSSAIPLLEKLKSKMMIKVSDRRMFDYTHKEIGTKELNILLEESKVFVAINHMKDGEYEKAIELLTSLKTPQAYYHLALAYQKVGNEERTTSSDDAQSKYASMLSKAKTYAYKALDLLNNNEANKNLPLYSDTQELIEDIEICINKIDPDVSRCQTGVDGNYSSDENVYYRNEPKRTYANIIRNISSTPKSNQNNTNFRTAIDSQILESSRVDQRNIERLENEIKNLQKRDTTITDFMEQTRSWFEENRNLGNKIINTINTNMQNTTDQFKNLQISVDQVKNQIDECRNECKDVGELKKQIAELKKEVNKLKKSSSEQAINEIDSYNVDDEYRTNETTSNFGSQLPFPPQMLPTYNQRPPFPVTPNPYQLYNQTLYNLYNQYAQASTVAGAPPLFDPTRTHMNFPGVYPTPDQMFLDMAHLIPPAAAPVPAAPVVPTMPVPHSLPTKPNVPPVPIVSAPLISTSIFNTAATTSSQIKKSSQNLPVNVVITSSDPLPTSASAPTPVLSVIIPQKHIKTSQPHNYQIALPTVAQTSTSSQPVFSFTMPESKSNPVSSLSNWNKAFQTFSGEDSALHNAQHGGDISIEGNKSVVDGPFAGAATNTSLNKSRTLSEKSNTSIENYDPCPDFKPIVPLPAEVAVTTGEEEETAIFSSRAKLFRFVDKQWKERGLGVMKLLKHNITGKVRVLMRREQVHKVCANHIITPEMEINPMKNETKAYIWVANDFAEETVVLEKFCIRFKTAEIAKQFYETFEKARQESAPLSTIIENTSANEPKSVTINKPEIKTSICSEVKPAISQEKTVIGGFTFSSTPLFKPLENDSKADVKTSDSESNKSNVFSTLTFKPSSSSPFNNLFNAPSESSNTTGNVEVNKDSDKNKLNSSDTVEEFEPNVEFKPVIALPALVEQKTGEEDEIVLFEHRAKLLRYDTTTKEWKERGLGIMKLLSHKENGKVRLLMRREQIMKVCCNHILTKEMTFQKMPKMDKAVTWCAKDFSEGELVAETFCLRFKTVQLCDDFIAAITTAQSKMDEDTKGTKDEKSALNQTPSGFGDKFKAKAGSWYCQGCYTNNLENYARCACCEQPKPETITKADASLESTKTSNWGDKFKPKPGSWECKSCFIRNEVNIENCTACSSPKDPATKSSTKSVTPDNKFNFTFGIPKQTAASIQNQNVSESAGFGDKFKPKAGTWECKQCYVRNASESENCCSCNTPHDSNTPKNSTGLVDITTSAPTVKFRFGIPPTITNEEKPKPETIFENTGASKFNFGIPANTSCESEKPKPTALIYDSPKIPSKADEPLNFSLLTTDKIVSLQTEVSKPISNKDNGFGFVFKTTSSKTPAKSPHKQENESEDDDLVREEDCSAHFNPVIPLPDKVEVVTGEENEEELYAHRARLYIFVSGEWKERGTGIVKILKNKETSKLRVVMRREQVFKICLNHALTSDIIYNPKDEKTWIFAANDFSEGELALHKFCLRFSNKEIAMQFKYAVDSAVQEKPLDLEEKFKQSENDKSSDDEVVFVSETQANAEDKQKAKDLMLPENYYNYKNKEPCQGCRGCSDDDVKLEPKTQTITTSTVATAVPVPSASVPASVVTPMKVKLPLLQSPTTSLYGTPGNDKTFDTSIFRTPLGSIGSNTVASTPTNNSNDSAGDATNKENVFGQKFKIFSNFGEQKSTFFTPQATLDTKNTAGDNQTPPSTKSSLLAPPKLSTIKVSGDNQMEGKTLFPSSQAKPAFGETSIFSNAAGISSNKSIFSLAADKQKEVSSEVKSIFGAPQPSVNLFSSDSSGSIFGPSSLNSNQPKIGHITFGSGGSSLFSSGQTQNSGFNSIFNSGQTQNSGFNSIFSNDFNKQSPVLGSNAENNQKPIGSFDKIQESKTENKFETKELPLNLDENLSFAALSTSGPGFEKKADFTWEGTGQQLFTTSQRNNSNNQSGAADVSGGDAEEEFDPHYEPIVPLPDKIEVTTGEEDEVKLFGERGKLYRYDDKAKEWKERGVGEVKILHHPKNNTYRLLLRREQVHKAVLNMLIHLDLELLPMKNSDCAWTWPGVNYAESTEGLKEMLALRFKNSNLAKSFRVSVEQCVRKLQASAAAAIREIREEKPKDTPSPSTVFGTPELLRLPKHLQETARADPMLAAAAQANVDAVSPKNDLTATKTGTKPNGDSKERTPPVDNQVIQESHEDAEDDEDDDDDEYEHEYDASDYYYNEEEAYYACEGEAIVKQGEDAIACPHANIQVLFDQEIYSPKILVTDANTGEILADMLIHTETDFKMDGDSCKWTGTDYTSNEPVDKTVTINFHDSESAMQFYDSCETSKAATYSSNDPES